MLNHLKELAKNDYSGVLKVYENQINEKTAEIEKLREDKYELEKEFKKLERVLNKWLGKSSSNTAYSQNRALSGAKQLADYMDDYNGQIPNNVPKGYLVVFDARRRKVDSPVAELTTEDVNFYSDKDIQYNPRYEEIRTDFNKPYRFFLKANLDN